MACRSAGGDGIKPPARCGRRQNGRCLGCMPSGENARLHFACNGGCAWVHPHPSGHRFGVAAPGTWSTSRATLVDAGGACMPSGEKESQAEKRRQLERPHFARSEGYATALHRAAARWVPASRALPGDVSAVGRCLRANSHEERARTAGLPQSVVARGRRSVASRRDVVAAWQPNAVRVAAQARGWACRQ